MKKENMLDSKTGIFTNACFIDVLNIGIFEAPYG